MFIWNSKKKSESSRFYVENETKNEKKNEIYFAISRQLSAVTPILFCRTML